jgi:hypothetical protein
MDELELLKKDWKSQEKDLPRFSAREIYPMMLKKSSSIVKWIFIISLLELAVCTFLNIFLMDEGFWEEVEHLHLKTATYAIYAISYLVTFVFIYFFYKNYRAISTTDSASKLMRNILKTRSVVKYYILFVLVANGITVMLFFIFSLIYPPENINLESLNWTYAILIGVVVTLVLLGVIWLIYTLLYGILLRKLKRNYRELKKLEMEQ